MEKNKNEEKKSDQIKRSINDSDNDTDNKLTDIDNNLYISVEDASRKRHKATHCMPCLYQYIIAHYLTMNKQ